VVPVTTGSGAAKGSPLTSAIVGGGSGTPSGIGTAASIEGGSARETVLIGSERIKAKAEQDRMRS
jgi:hypothetical protein